MTKYSIGIDYGTLSGRAILVDVSNGEQLAESVFIYPHAVMDKTLWDGARLPDDWALQHPQDYLDTLFHTVPALLRESGISPEDIIGIGVDFTSCTMLPCKGDGTPLCMLPAFSHTPHAYVKLWKHHAAQPEATRLTETAERMGEPWLRNYGGKISSEWSVPKLMQVLDEAPEVFAATEKWIEAADWIIWQMTGKESRSACCAGYKGLWNKGTGYPSNSFFKALDPRLEHVAETLLAKDILPLGARAGGLTRDMARRLGLQPDTSVAVGIIDAHVCVPAVGIDGPGKMLAIMGTSTCHMVNGTAEKQVPGMCGVVADGILPGFFGYEAGQSCVGDHFAWFTENCCPGYIRAAASERDMTVQAYLTLLAGALKPGQSGLVALDWWNGNRSVLVDVDLTGMLVGLTLASRPEEIYRALLEATAYGTRMIVDNYVENGVDVTEFYASGGIAQKNALMMQIYADVLNRPVKIAGTAQGPALGSAIFGAVAAGKTRGGYADVFSAARRMGKADNMTYMPIRENAAVYDQLYAEYRQLHDYFGRGANDVMKRLKKLKAAQN